MSNYDDEAPDGDEAAPCAPLPAPADAGNQDADSSSVAYWPGDFERFRRPVHDIVPAASVDEPKGPDKLPLETEIPD